MAILCDSQIRELIGIEPFEENTKRGGKISFGVSSYGYDLRVGSIFKVFTNVNSETVETVSMPRDCLAICVGKSTYARCGIIVNVTPIEPEWRGKITLEISNTT